MNSNSNQITQQIYYRPLHKWIDVTAEEKQNWERFVNTIRKSKQRDGTCCIPYKKSYKCDGLCEECEYRCTSKEKPGCLSIDSEVEDALENGVSQSSFLGDALLTTEINMDAMILNHLLTELKEIDPESYQMLMLLAEGLSERACAERLNIPRNTFVYKKNKLLNSLRKNF